MKYYYSCWIKAEYMARYFGMKLSWDHWGKEYTTDDTMQIVYEHDEFGIEGPFYIHPDGLPILKPQPGDLCTVFGSACFMPADDGRFPSRVAKELIERNIQPGGTGGITQRNNTPFLWPEVEQ